MAQIELITFDLDNTLWDVHSVIRHAEREMRSWLSEHVADFRLQQDPEAMQQLRTRLVRENPKLAHDVSALRKAVLEEAISASGYSHAEARRLAAAAFDVFFEARQQVVFFDGALETLARLAADYRLGALTNGNADIEKTGLSAYLEFAYSSADVGISKPAPDMFHAALQHCRLDAERAIHVGDNLIDDIQGAASIGIHTIWTNHDAQELDPATHEPTEIVEHLKQLPGAVEKIQGR